MTVQWLVKLCPNIPETDITKQLLQTKRKMWPAMQIRNSYTVHAVECGVGSYLIFHQKKVKCNKGDASKVQNTLDEILN